MDVFLLIFFEEVKSKGKNHDLEAIWQEFPF